MFQITWHLQEYIDTLEAFHDVKLGCFGYKLDPNYYKSIRTFELKMVILKIKFKVSVLPKCHGVFEHIQQVILETGRAIGQDSEQVLETGHQKFHKVKIYHVIFVSIYFSKSSRNTSV